MTANRNFDTTYPETGQDISQLRLLSIFNYILVGLCILGLPLLGGIYFAGDMAMANYTKQITSTYDSPISGSTWDEQQHRYDQLETIYLAHCIQRLGFLVMCIAVAVIFSIVGFICLVAGNSLRKHNGYWFSFVIAILHLFNMPLGTALGIFTLIVLNRPSVKALFKQNLVLSNR